MGVVVSPPAGPALVASSTGEARFETNRIYQSGLLEAEDVWLWEALVSGASRTKEFSLLGVDALGERAGGGGTCRGARSRGRRWTTTCGWR